MKSRKTISSTRAKGTAYFMDVPVLEYNAALDLQHRLVAARIDGTLDRDIVLLLEHPPVFTLGRRGGLDNLKISEAFLRMREIPVIQVERGGDITYHGPGQLVVYPIVDLRAGRCRIVQFVDYLEEIMIRTLTEWRIDADRNPVNRGVWVGPAKIGSLGIAVRRSISFHGFALNVNISLEPFGWVNPCGLEGVRVTSMQQELSRKVVIEDVRRVICFNFQEIFGVKMERISLDELHGLLGADARTLVRTRVEKDGILQ